MGISMSQKTKTVLIIPDLHIPYHDAAALEVVEKCMADHDWDEVVYLGDLLDLDEISSFNAENLRELETRRLVEDFHLANAILDRHQEIVRRNNPKAKFVLLQGNHEYRIERLLDNHPELEGLLEVQKNLHLSERKVRWVKSWSENELYAIGKLCFSHGLYINQYHAAKMVNSFGVNVVYGHTHDVMSHVKTILGKDKLIMAQSLGFLADEYKLRYMKKGPSNWSQAFGVAYIRPTGEFNLYPVHIINHQFTFNGKEYK